jgi:hypothetical protein
VQKILSTALALQLVNVGLTNALRQLQVRLRLLNRVHGGIVAVLEREADAHLPEALLDVPVGRFDDFVSLPNSYLAIMNKILEFGESLLLKLKSLMQMHDPCRIF